MGQVKALLYTCTECGDDIDPRSVHYPYRSTHNLKANQPEGDTDMSEANKVAQLMIEPDNNPVHEAVLFYWGERCPEHEEGCPTCTAWKLYDKLIGETK